MMNMSIWFLLIKKLSRKGPILKGAEKPETHYHLLKATDEREGEREKVAVLMVFWD